MTYFVMHSGRKINIDNISERDICIEDIAHHLTKICRYGGALPLDAHYSVATHSINLYYYAKFKGYGKDVKKALLLHDSSEAYLGDIIRGLKHLLPDYQVIEMKINNIINKKYNVRLGMSPLIKELDTRIVLDEVDKFFPDRYNLFEEQIKPLKKLDFRIYKDNNLQFIKNEFIDCCKEVGVYDR